MKQRALLRAKADAEAPIGELRLRARVLLGPDRYARRIHGSERSGAKRVSEQSFCGRGFHLSRTAQRSVQKISRCDGTAPDAKRLKPGRFIWPSAHGSGPHV